MNKEALKRKLDELEAQEMQITKEWKETYNKIKEIEKEENSWVTVKLPLEISQHL